MIQVGGTTLFAHCQPVGMELLQKTEKATTRNT
jgi:hypothetical protein